MIPDLDNGRTYSESSNDSQQAQHTCKMLIGRKRLGEMVWIVWKLLEEVGSEDVGDGSKTAQCNGD
jgi:hypothetical protein